MNEVAKDDGRELSQAEKLAKAEEFKAKYAKGELADGTIVKLNTRVEPDRKAEMEDRLAKIEALRKIGWDREEKARAQWLKRREREKAEEPKVETPKLDIEEITAEAKAEEPKAESKTNGADEETARLLDEAFKDEAPVPPQDLSIEEQKARRIIRWKKRKEINSKYSVIRSYGGKCVVMTEGRSPVNPRKKIFIFQLLGAFKEWTSNQYIPSLKKKNENDAVGPWWLHHPKRQQYDEAAFLPLQKPVIVTPDGQTLRNTYRGWGVEPKQGDWSLIRLHIKEVLADGDPKIEEYILRWTAWSIQHPDQLPLVALVLIGRKGRGKGTWARVLEKIYGNHSLQISSQHQIVGRFNKHLEDLILLISDEAYWAGHKADAGTLQRMITEPTLAVEPKGVDVRVVKNYIHLLMLTEPGWAVPAGQDERRYAIYEVCRENRGDAYFKALYQEIAGGGPAAMLYDLQRMNLGDWHPRQIYRTAAFRRQQDMSLGHLEEWLLMLLEEGSLPSSPLGKPWASGPTALLNDVKYKVPRCRDATFNTLSAFLLEWGCRKTEGENRYYHFPPLAEIRDAWDQRFAPREWSPISDWGHAVEPPLNEFLDEKL